jgi:hypothetical protein
MKSFSIEDIAMIYNEKDIIIAYSMKKRLMKWKIRPEVLLANIIMKRRNEFARANKRKERDPAHCRNRGYAIEEMSAMRDDEFKRMFRVDRSTFEFLCNDNIIIIITIIIIIMYTIDQSNL